MDFSLNKSSRPCDDFYEFACGGWISKTALPPSEPVWSHWQTINQKITERLQAMLPLNTENEPEAYEKARKMYTACLDTEKSKEEKSVGQLKGLIRELGGWPLVDKSSNWNEASFDWVLQVAKIIKNFGVHPLFKVFPGIDYKNTKRYILYVSIICLFKNQIIIIINIQNSRVGTKILWYL